MVTISVITYSKNKFWAFKQMQLLPPRLAKIKGSSFVKLLGTGSGFGFSLWPDFATYTLLMEWESVEASVDFFEHSSVFKQLQYKSEQIETHYLESLGAHGSWHGQNPFSDKAAYNGGQIAVITRARININKLPQFWKFVPAASKSIEQAKGLIYTKGVGEWPFIELATVSVWENEQAMIAYAYTGIHKEVITHAKQGGWFKEELFGRFNYLKSIKH